MIADLIDGLLVIAFYAALVGLALFTTVLGQRALDAHHRGIARIRHQQRNSQ